MTKRKIIRLIEIGLIPIDFVLSVFKVFQKEQINVTPIFILGAPRSGTTMISQIVFNAIQRKSFLANVDNYLPNVPFITSFIKKKVKTQNLTSNYGRIEGLGGLSEAGNVWNKWFPDETKDGYNYVNDFFFSDSQVIGIRKFFKRQCVSQSSGVFINKNVKHSVRILALNKVFPNASYIIVKRDLHDNALSLLKAREVIGQGKNEWLWAKPRDYNQLIDKEPEESVVGQVALINKDIDRDIKLISRRKIVFVDYDLLLENGKTYLDNTLKEPLEDWTGQNVSFSEKLNSLNRKGESKRINPLIKNACAKWK